MANRNGFYYLLDRATGEFLQATAYAKQTWAKDIDDSGRPVLIPGADPSVEVVARQLPEVALVAPLPDERLRLPQELRSLWRSPRPSRFLSFRRPTR